MKRKNNNNKSFAEDDLKEELNEAINGLLEENENLEKRIENKLEEKINDIMMNKIMILEQDHHLFLQDMCLLLLL